MRKQFLSAAVLASLALGLAPAAVATAAPLPQPVTVAKAASVATPTLKPGSRGPAVLRVQRILGIKQTGVFDRATVAAVKTFQKAHGIYSSGGYVGPRTWAALATLEKQQAAVYAARIAFREAHEAAASDLAMLTKVVTNPVPGGARLPAQDAKLLLGRIARAQEVLAAANTVAVKPSATVSQVTSATTQVTRAHAAAAIVGDQYSAAWYARPASFQALLTSTMNDELAFAKKTGRVIDTAKEQAARAAVLRTAAQAQRPAMVPALKLLSIDPLGPQAGAQAAAATKAVSKAADGPEGKAFEAAWDAYQGLLRG